MKKFWDDVSGSTPVAEITPPEVVVSAVLEDLSSEDRNLVQDWLIDDTYEKARLAYRFSPRSNMSDWIEEARTQINNEGFENRPEFPMERYGHTISGGTDTTNAVDPYFLKAIKFEFLDALRDAKTQLMAGGESRLLYKVLRNRGMNSFIDIKSAISDLSAIVANNKELITVKTELEKYLGKMSLVPDDLKNRVEFLFSHPEENEMLKKLSLQYGDSPVDVERNGTGRNNLLFISLLLSHLLYQNSPEVKFRIIGVEEPEAHLHPHLQEHLTKNLKKEPHEPTQKGKLQIIATSHCPHITSKLELENTAILYENDTTVESCYFIDNFRDKDGKLNAEAKAHIRYLERFLDATKSTMFFGRRLILVEGVAEQILVPSLFEIYSGGTTLEKIGCTVVNVAGVGFRHFLEIVSRGFFIKCVAFTDSDSETQTKDRADKLKIDYSDSEIIQIEHTETSTFEKELVQNNRSAKGKAILLNALKQTRRNKGAAYEKELGDKAIVESDFFQLIEEGYKAEFAMDLKAVLDNKSDGFVLPQYFINGFEFLNS